MLDLKSISLQFIVEKIGPAIVIFMVGYILLTAVLKLVKKLLEKGTKIDSMLNRFILSTVKVILWVVLILTVLQKLGVDATSFLTVFAAAGAAVALALKDSLSNLAGGILIMITRPFSHGDYISCNDKEGFVDSIDLLYTTIFTADNKKISIPNGQLTSNAITNFDGNDKRRVEITIGVSYEADLELAKNTLLLLAQECGLFLEDPATVCHVHEYGDSAITLVFRGWVKHKDYWDAFYYLQDHLKAAFDKQHIEIPYPQMDIHSK